MNALNGVFNALFDLLCRPAAWIGETATLILLSGVFGVLALFAFKYLSAQRRIKAAKDKIKAHMIEIRIYQDDLALVSKAIGKVFARNLQYLALNLLPFVPLSIPFSFVVAQLVTRFAFAPAAVHPTGTTLLAGQGTTLEVWLAPEQAERVSELVVHYPPGVEALSPLVRVPFDGRAYQEIVARAPGRYELSFTLGGETQVKEYLAGVAPRAMQAERGKSLFSALLWPVEAKLPSDSAFEKLCFTEYPAREISWMPTGPGGVLLVFVVASILFGLAAMKPLRVEI